VNPLPANLRPDCAACCALCCVAPPFDTDQGFGHDKPAHEPCRHLEPDFRCAIHSRLAESGYPGCAGFDCFGAGQRVTQELFGGASWSKSPDFAVEMFECYERLRPLHELMALATLAMDRTQDEALRLELRDAVAGIEVQCSRQSRPDVAQLRRSTVDLMRRALADQERPVRS
jgi:hypothetical protein